MKMHTGSTRLFVTTTISAAAADIPLPMVPTDAQPLPCAQVADNAQLPGLMLASALCERAELGQPLCSPKRKKAPGSSPNQAFLEACETSEVYITTCWCRLSSPQAFCTRNGMFWFKSPW